jgi:hypothetical protein
LLSRTLCRDIEAMAADVGLPRQNLVDRADTPAPPGLRPDTARVQIVGDLAGPHWSVVGADPCEGRLPSAAGQKFEGLVRYAGDGDSLCSGQSPDPLTWIEVRLADFDAPELDTVDFC